MRKIKFFFVAVIVLLIACEQSSFEIKKGSEKNLEINQNVKVENEYLVFESMEQIVNLVSEIETWDSSNYQVWLQSLGFESARSYLDGMVERATKNDNSNINQVFEVLKEQGYYDPYENCIAYPFDLTRWASVISVNGLIKIDGIIYKIIKSDRIKMRDNSYQTLMSISNLSEYHGSDVIVCNDIFPKITRVPITTLKSEDITIAGNGPLLQWDLVATDVVSGREYRVKTQLLYYGYLNSSNQVYLNYLYVSSLLHQKILGVWWPYNDYYFFKLWNRDVGGNLARTNSSIYHQLTYDYPSNPVFLNNQIQRSEHNIAIHSEYLPNIPAAEFIFPDVNSILCEFYTMKVQERQWLGVY